MDPRHQGRAQPERARHHQLVRRQQWISLRAYAGRSRVRRDRAYSNFPDFSRRVVLRAGERSLLARAAAGSAQSRSALRSKASAVERRTKVALDELRAAVAASPALQAEA